MNNIQNSKNFTKALKYVDDNSSYFIQELKELCSFSSVSGRTSELNATADWIEKKLNNLGLETKLTVNDSGVPIIFGKIQGKSDKTLLIYNYYDVVSEGNLNDWDTHPFIPEVKRGRIYARGVDSNKGNLLARIHALEAYLKGAKSKPPVTIKFLFEGEEEIGSPNLSNYFRQQKDILSADACLWAVERKDNLDRPHISLGTKGGVNLELRSTTNRNEIHSSFSTIVPNPAIELINVLNSLVDKDGFYKLKGFYDDVMKPSNQERELLSKILFDKKKFKRELGIDSLLGNETNAELLYRQYFKPTFTICGLFSGYTGKGTKSVIPNEATAKIEFRLVAHQKASQIISQLQEHLEEKFDKKITCEVMSTIDPAKTPLSSPIVNAAYNAVKQTNTLEPVILPTSTFSGQMGLVHSILEAPAIGIGIGDNKSNPHGPNESIKVSDYFEGIHFIAAFLQNLAVSDSVN